MGLHYPTTELDDAEIWWYKQNNRREFFDWLFTSGSDLDDEGKERALTMLAEANYMFRLGHFEDVLIVFMDRCTDQYRINKLNQKLYKGRIVHNDQDYLYILK